MAIGFRIAKHILLFLVGVMLSAALAEVVLRQLPVAMGLYRTTQHELWPLYGYGQGQRYTYSITWQMLFPRRGTTNNYGQIAPFDYQRHSRPVAVIGDSFIESQMNSFDDTLQGELGRLLGGDMPVYGFGFAGNSLAEYLALARMTRGEFSPRAMVFLIVHNDVKESWTNRIGHHFFRVDAAGVSEDYLPLDRVTLPQRVRATFGDSAFYRYVQSNLGFSIDRVLGKYSASGAAKAEVKPHEDERSREVIDYFLARLPEAAGLPAANLVFVFDSDRARIYDAEAPARKTIDSPAVQTYFRNRAEALGYAVIETRDLFQRHYDQHGRRFDYLPVDSHWNGLGHRTVGAAVARYLGETLNQD